MMRWLERVVQMGWFYYAVKWIFYAFARLVFDLQIHGTEHVPAAGKRGLVVASNHISAWDPPMLGCTMPREIHYMAKKELFEGRWFRLLILGLRAFPVDRQRNDIGAIKVALRRLRRGIAIGIFAQGTRNVGDAAAFDGAAFLAQRADVPLLPAAIWREGRRFHVRYGVPFEPLGTSRAEIHATTAELMQRVNTLLPDHLRSPEPASRLPKEL